MGWLDTVLAIANSEIGKGAINAGVQSLTNSKSNATVLGGPMPNAATAGIFNIPGITGGGTIGVGNQSTSQMPVWLWPVIAVVAFSVIVLALFKKK